MAALSSTSELRVELQRVNADKNLSVEVSGRVYLSCKGGGGGGRGWM